MLLDEIVCSTVHRCLEPVMMEPSVCSLTVFYKMFSDTLDICCYHHKILNKVDIIVEKCLL